MIKSDSVANLVKALAAAQEQFNPVLKDKDNPFFKSKYADLAAGITATQPALIANGLVISQLPVSAEGRVGVFTMLMHISGEFIGESYTLPTVKQDAQAGAAAITYARRAAYLGAIGVAAEDDDGNTAADRKVEHAPSRREFKQPPPFSPALTPRQIIAEERELKPVAIPNPPAASPQNGIAGQVGEEQLDKYRRRCVVLQKKLADAGLKSSRNMRIGSKFLKYLLDTTGAASVDQITTTVWDTFLSASESMDIEKLVKQVNLAVKENQKEGQV